MFNLKFFYASSLIVVMLGFSACNKSPQERSKSPQELIIGHWSCNQKQDSIRASGDIEYVSDGTSNGILDLEFKESGNLKISVTIRGKWSIKNDKLLESATKFTVIAISFDGQNLPPSSLPKEIKEIVENIKEMIIGTSSESDIIQLDNRVLLTKAGKMQVTCSRE